MTRAVTWMAILQGLSNCVRQKFLAPPNIAVVVCAFTEKISLDPGSDFTARVGQIT
ncbi:hypothetical protein M404DRAFT_996358 [Pisolithus tinctorius Marx 270]|uniref:Uncharacterized protein n=1 Tax=Pisolithus tinctorius Marx 270 TaxID=870435 RepID=A0A0C3KIU0_PISTI|nr:hypothetical protein M404DRAFT_996358 [Pisolithus tinctorius Marx 270]